ncbi:hypothetical protein BH11ARM2_BH11ARM2_21890 [soil metagenome]
MKENYGRETWAVRRHPSGFTLIEILTVMAIIAVLAGISFSALGNGKAAAKKVSCISGIRQMAFATHLYLEDADGRFPPLFTGVVTPGEKPTVIYNDLLLSYLGSFVRCPDIPSHSEVKPSLNTGYCANSSLELKVSSKKNLAHYYVPYRLQDVSFPSTTVLVPECRTGAIGLGFADTRIVDEGVMSVMNRFGDGEREGNVRHNNGGNVAFVDEHAKWFPSTGYPTNLAATEDRPGFGIGLPGLRFE